MQKKFVWVKWVDPLNSNIDEVEWPGHTQPLLPGEERKVDFLAQQGNLQTSHFHGADPDQLHAIKPVRIIGTQHGFVTLTEHSFAAYHFDFWTLVTNFDITNEVARAIETSHGVETINVLTRYRVRIGFPRPLIEAGVITTAEIKKGIEANILKLDNKERLFDDPDVLFLFNEEMQDLIKKTKRQLADSQHWAMYVLPNGSIETYAEPIKTNDFANKLELFDATQTLIGGSVLTSEQR